MGGHCRLAVRLNALPLAAPSFLGLFLGTVSSGWHRCYCRQGQI